MPTIAMYGASPPGVIGGAAATVKVALAVARRLV